MPEARAASTIICSDSPIPPRAPAWARCRALARSFVPAISPATPCAAPIAGALSTPAGVSIIASNGLPICFESSAASLADSTLGTTKRSAAEARTADTSSACQGVSAPLIRMAASFPANPATTASTAASLAAALSSGRTASSRSRITRSCCNPRAFSMARAFEAGRYKAERGGRKSERFIRLCLAHRAPVGNICRTCTGGMSWASLFWW